MPLFVHVSPLCILVMGVPSALPALQRRAWAADSLSLINVQSLTLLDALVAAESSR